MGTVKYTGPVASFHCPTEATIRSLKVHFSPKQEGSGDPSPENVRPIVGWEGVEVQQTGKNLVIPIEPYLLPNIWADNNKVTTTGKGKIYSVYLPCKPNTTYTCSKSVESVVFVVCYTKELPQVGVPIYGRIQHNNQDLTITTSSDAKYLFLWFYNNVYGNEIYTYDKVLDTIQIEESTFVTPYEPYHGSTTNYEFGVLGKNKLPITTNMEIKSVNTGYDNTLQRDMTPGILYPNVSANNYWLGTSAKTFVQEVQDGSITFQANDGSYGIGTIVPVQPQATYTISYTTSDNQVRMRIGYYDADGYFTKTHQIVNNGASFTIPSEVYHMIIVATPNTDYYNQSITVSNLQLELGSSATTYEPYDPKHTVYGGWVDLVTGEVCETYRRITLTGDETIRVNSWKTGVFDIQWYNSASNNKYRFVDGTVNNTFCNMLVPTNASYFLETEGAVCARGGDGESQFTYLIWKDTTTFGTTIDECKIKLKELYDNNTPLEIFVEKQPRDYTTYHLAPTQLQTFLGHNNVWSNADYVEVEYDLHETQTILARKQFIMANQPHIVKPAAAPLQNFVTDMVAPLKECKVHFSPVQEGTGDPSPENVRAISGWNDITLYTDKNKNLFDQSHLLELSGWTTTTNVTSPNGTTVYTGTIRSMYDSWKNHVPTDCTFKENTRYVVGLWWRRITPSTSNGMKFIIVYTDGTSTTATNQSNNTENFVINYLVSAANKTVDYIRLTYGTSTNVYVTGMFIQEYENFENSYPLPSVDKVEVSLPETVYGGYVDLVTGEVVQEWSSVVIDGTENWSTQAPHDNFARIFLCNPTNSTMLGNSNASNPNGITDWLDTVKASSDEKVNGRLCCRFGWGDKNFYILNAVENIEEVSDVTSLKSYLSQHPLRIVYKLAAPIYYSLTPTQLKTLRGTNNIWASNGGDNIEIAYWKH